MRRLGASGVRSHRLAMARDLLWLDVRMSTFRFLGIAFVFAVLAACAGSTSPTSPSAGSTVATASQLAGTWTLEAIKPTGRAEQIVPAGAIYTLTFADGRLSTRADCNTCTGTFTLSEGLLTAGPALGCTRAACRTMAFENEYTGLLTGESTATLQSGTLLLSSARGTLRFTRR
jgi:heat shock protein HslJ